MTLFVFFKQKTAYEMRISDWSSDVCSSDLLSCPFREDERPDWSGLPQRTFDRQHCAGDVSARPRAEEDHRAANIFGRAQTASGNARNHLLLQPRNSLKEAVGHVAWEEARRNGIDVDPLRHIGRASCRERVCQYV